MTILQELAGLYENRARERGWPQFGFSTERIGAAVVLESDGAVGAIRPMNPPNDKGNLEPQLMKVPEPPKDRRGLKLVAGQFWDRMPYALGVSGKPDKVSFEEGRAGEKFRVFRDSHLKLLDGTEDVELVAFRNFCETWMPERFLDFPDAKSLVGQNIVFQLNNGLYLHDLPAARSLLTEDALDGKKVCLVTGRKGPFAWLHPEVKGVAEAQSSGARLVSFNNSAERSHGKEKGENAPVSKRAAFQYGTALNALLAKGAGNSVRVGGDTVVFWADQPKAEETLEAILKGTDDASTKSELEARVKAVAVGRMRTNKNLDSEARLFILGLAPNSARLVVRYWHPSTFGDFARHIDRFWADLQIEPAPWKGPPAARSLLYETAIRLGGKPRADTIPQLLGGQIMRSVLTGQPLPRTLMSAVIARTRADGQINGRRAAICKAVINRTTKEEKIPVSLDPDNRNTAYRLGRLFAVLERAQSKALPELNATIKDRYFAAASTTPARVFPLLIKQTTHHIASLRKAEDNRGLANWLEREIGEIWLGLDADMPCSLSLEGQGCFIAGYYHQCYTKTILRRKTNDRIAEPL